jgi:hypothetical protein
MKTIFLLILILTGLYSCEPIDGKFDPQGFSGEVFSIGAQGMDTIITSQRDVWFFAYYIIYKTKNGGYEYIYFPVCEEVAPPDEDYRGPNKARKPGVCSDSIMTVKYGILKDDRIEVVQFENDDWFKVTKETPKRLHVIIKPNLTGETRHLLLAINTMLYTKISIIQSSE